MTRQPVEPVLLRVQPDQIGRKARRQEFPGPEGGRNGVRHRAQRRPRSYPRSRLDGHAALHFCVHG
ncbi:hypothetical protein [Sphingopyxis sp. PET50]|uniref:hypothetical protein n=1 Tax=Sphingopyxis sp. PET50 TaxID=2976533 RepID=UPI0021AEB46B|nr:hypothetical protein [Sphingopyxis sp. PET50]